MSPAGWPATNKNKIDLTISSFHANKYSTPMSCRIVSGTPQQEEEKEGQRMVFLEMHFPHTTPPSLHLVSAIHRSLFFTSTGYRGQRYFMMASNRLHRASSHTTVSIRSFHRYLSFAIYCIIVFQPTFSQAWEKRQTSHGKSVIAYYAR